MYTEFDINMPKDSGVMIFIFNASAGKADYSSWQGGFKGTDKVFFQDVMTLPFKLNMAR